MIVIAGLVLGGLWGGMLARRRGGARLDIAQYAAVYAILFGVLGMIATIALERLL
ncbi:hypothetical protein U879_04070 [Defluviimonas sp. 20V17]|uniref:Uncharacterized protein n=1 Tax=Allgaiera indica TaxID=765699 RepID=A0AAN5A1H4_9RHOB|nr:hypothetical protein [Allgaiera indica]KDB04922.1 hypothetical protein U879_04070 [Defluviimonas sp. 20V17]GHE05670.1 hypothetical protein GCM10008024_37340 [Allgaiera indica]SDX76048.1 hypothetical protein SAMN05444006_1286 [Allgaiera indica]